MKNIRDLRVNTLEDEQWYALIRINSIAEGHLKEKYTNPILCAAIFQLYELSKEYISKYNSYMKTLKEEELKNISLKDS